MLKPPFQIVIADDHPLVRAGVIATLEACPEFQVIGEARDGHEAMRILKEHPCDLLILDLEMDGPGTEKLIQTCQQWQPSLKILILSSHLEAEYLAPLKGLGIAGYVLKDEAPDCLLQAVRVVSAGSVWFSHTVLQKTMELTRRQRSRQTAPLTPREMQVLEKIREGKDNQTIANELSLSKQTVRRYATLIYEKLGVKNRVEAIVYANYS